MLFIFNIIIILWPGGSSLNSVGMLRIWHRTQLLHWNCIFTEIQDGGSRHLEFWKSVATSLLLDRSSPNLVGMMIIWHETQLLHSKMHLTKTWDGGRRHLEFRKSVAISLLFDQSSPNSVGMLRIWHKTQLLHWNCEFTKIQDGGRRNLDFWKYSRWQRFCALLMQHLRSKSDFQPSHQIWWRSVQ